MVIQDLLIEGVHILREKSDINANLEVRLILSRLLEVDKSYIYAHGDKEVTDEISQIFISYVRKRKEGYPLQYILGQQEFMGLNFSVNEGVLIPRGDTEILVNFVLKYIRKSFRGESFRLLDIGIGSGSISLSIANQHPEGEVFGVDIDDKPLEVAEKNRKKFKLVNVEYFKGDLFSPFTAKEWNKSFNIIVSNPPYIPNEDIGNLQREVKEFEPMLALAGGVDGLDFYRRIAKEAGKYLSDKNILVFEVGYNQGIDVSNILGKEGFRDIEIIKDLEDRDRIVCGKL